MAKQANRKIIGGFVVIAAAILAVSVVIFGSGDFFEEKDRYVLYFEGSVKGLNIGSPVLFRGVQVGTVTQIVIRSYAKGLQSYIPVYIEVHPERIDYVGHGGERVKESRERLKKLIELGLRAQLSIQSIITGQLLIEVDMHPETPINLKNLDKEYFEIPTIPSTIARLGKYLEKLDLNEITARLTSILTSIDNLLKNPEIKSSLNELKGVLQDARGLVQNVNAKVEPLADSLNGTLDDAKKLMNEADREFKSLTGKAKTTLDDYGRLARDVNTKVEPLSDAVIAAMNAAESALESIDGLVGKDSPTRADLETTLRELSGAARSLRILADYLEQHPEALIKGKSYTGY